MLAILRLDSGQCRAEYYDSMGTSNLAQATKLAPKLVQAMTCTGGDNVKVRVCEAPIVPLAAKDTVQRFVAPDAQRIIAFE